MRTNKRVAVEWPANLSQSASRSCVCMTYLLCKYGRAPKSNAHSNSNIFKTAPVSKKTPLLLAERAGWHRIAGGDHMFALRMVVSLSWASDALHRRWERVASCHDVKSPIAVTTSLLWEKAVGMRGRLAPTTALLGSQSCLRTSFGESHCGAMCYMRALGKSVPTS